VTMPDDNDAKCIAPKSDELADALTSIIRAAQATPGPMSLLDALRSPDMQIHGDAAMKLHKWCTGLPPILLADRRFGGTKPRMIRGESGASGFYPNFVAPGLVRKALESGDATSAICWLQKVMSTPYADGVSITALWGVPIDQRVDLTPDVSIIPMKDVPDSEQKQWIDTMMYAQSDSLTHSALNIEPPTSALIKRRRIEPFIVDAGEPAEQSQDSNQEYLATHTLFQDIISVLTIVGPRVSLPFSHWFTYDDPDLQGESLMGSSRSGSLIEILPWNHDKYPPLDPVEAPTVVQAYLALKPSVRDIFNVSIQRINQAQRRRGVGDKAVELCTALETLMGDSGNTEMTHKIKVRATRLVGGAPSVRIYNAALLSETYAIRSKLVHTGKVDENRRKSIGGRELTRVDVVKETVQIAVELVKVLIRRGGIPDWTEFDVTEQVT
jgi:hypothetical protein